MVKSKKKFKKHHGYITSAIIVVVILFAVAVLVEFQSGGAIAGKGGYQVGTSGSPKVETTLNVVECPMVLYPSKNEWKNIPTGFNLYKDESANKMVVEYESIGCGSYGMYCYYTTPSNVDPVNPNSVILSFSGMSCEYPAGGGNKCICSS